MKNTSFKNIVGPLVVITILISIVTWLGIKQSNFERFVFENYISSGAMLTEEITDVVYTLGHNEIFLSKEGNPINDFIVNKDGKNEYEILDDEYIVIRQVPHGNSYWVLLEARSVDNVKK